jgi:outer membrane protein assembly factor BamB
MRKYIIEDQGRKNMKKHFLVIVVLFLFVFSSFPVAFGYNLRRSNAEPIVKSVNFNSYLISEITRNSQHTSLDDISETNIVVSNQIDTFKETLKPFEGPMDSPWPMYCHDVRHTGRSPYSTADNNGYEKWRIRTDGWADGSPVIDNDGIIYIGAKKLYAVYPNGTKKWEYDIPHRIEHAPAIDENGIIYFGTVEAIPNYLYAIYSNNGTLKWKYKAGNDIHGSPAIGKDGTIYFGKDESGSPPYSGYIIALYPDGTEKWRYKTNHFIYSSPAIGEDGTIYCGSHDTYLYALSPDNGTLKWKYKTGDWVGRGPSVADDGTVYFGSWDGYLYAVYPNGTLKWKTGSYLAGTTPITGNDGTIYVGNNNLYAIYPENGTIKWSFKLEENEDIRGSNPCISADGTIYFGTHIRDYYGGEIIAVNPDGTEKWRKMIADAWVDSAPAIGEDGTVYIGSTWKPSDGFLHAFGYPGPNPLAPDINGPTTGKPGTPYTYSFTSIDPDGDEVSYYIDWDDGHITDWTGFQPSGNSYSESHTWTTKGTYTIRAKAKDTDGYESDWGTLEVTIPRDKAINNVLLWRLIGQFPILQKLMLYLIKFT